MEVVSMVHVHLQEHRGRPGFSRTDLRENALFVPDFWNVQPNLPHGAVVFSFDFEAVDPYSMRGQAVKLGPMPPSPLGGPRGFWDVEPARLSHMVNALYAKYDALNFGVVSWAYWHAVTATPHIAAVHFGAALESLQRAYFTSSSTPPIGTVVDEPTWEKIRSALETSLAPLGLAPKTLDVFKNKIRNLNSRSQHSTSKDLMDRLGIILSSREKQAHDARHESAHGKDDEIDVEFATSSYYVSSSIASCLP